MEQDIISLPYIDIQVSLLMMIATCEADNRICTQHDALAVFDDVTQGTVHHEDIWISGVHQPIAFSRLAFSRLAQANVPWM